MPRSLRRAAADGPFVVIVTMFASGASIAQTSLPTVVVTTPSPVAKSAPAAPAPKAAPVAPKAATPPTKAAPAPKTAAQPPAPAVVPPSPLAPPPTDTLPAPPGVLIVPPGSFASVAITPSREITSTRGATIADTLMSRPGVTGSTFAAGASRPVIRGLDNNRVLVQENGIGSGDVSSLSEDHGVPIDPFSATQIEVVRGPATLRYGGQAIGGIVNVTNGRIPEAMPRNGVSAEVKSGVSSVDNGREVAERATAGAGNVVVYADRFDRRAGDYQTPHGRQLNTFVESSGFAFGGSFVSTDGFAGVAISRFSSLYGIPGVIAAAEQKRIDMEQTRLQSKGEWRIKGFGIEAIRYWFGHSDYAHNELAFDQDLGRDTIGSRFLNRQTEGRIEIQHQPVMTALGRLTGAVGIQSSQRKVSGLSFEGDNLLDPARTQSSAVFLFEELEIMRGLRWQGAARYETTNVRGTAVDTSDPAALTPIASDRTFRPFSASAGLLVDLPAGVVLRLTGQHTERAPAEAELLSKGAHEATGTFEIGNPLLTIETAHTAELGFRRAKGDFRFDASFYYTQFHNFIFKRLTGQTCETTLASCERLGGAGGDLKELLFAQRDATFYGTELIGQLDIAPLGRGVWGIEGQYDFVHAEFANGEKVPRIPPHRLGGGVYYRDANWLAKVWTLHAFRQDRIAPNETPTSGYTLLNAELSYTRRLSGDRIVPEITLGIRGDNLLNDDVRNHVSFKKDEALLPGASVRLFGTLKLN